jgi:FkbM family methyltransferase
MIKTVTKKVLHAAGFELRRATPRSDPDGDFDPRVKGNSSWLKNLNIHSVFDIGANTGQFAADIRKILPDALIFAFEPLKDCYERMLERMKNVPNFKAFNFALGNEGTEVDMHRSSYSPSSSILPMGSLHKKAFPFTNGGSLERITVRRLDDVAKDLALLDNLLVKIDVQGFEDKVLVGGAQTIKKATALIVETSFKRLYEGQPLFDEIYVIIREMGFLHHGNLNQLLNPKDGSVLQADGIFIKSAKSAEKSNEWNP